MTRPQVLWLVKGLGWGGTERLLSLAASRIDHDRFAVRVAYVTPERSALAPAIRRTGVPVVCLGRGRGGRGAWPWRLHRLLAQEGIDLVHTHSPVPALVARLGPSRHRPALVHTEHSAWPRYREPTRSANRLTFGCNDWVLAVSEGVRGSITSPGGAPPVELLYHGVDPTSVPRGPEAKAAARSELGLAPSSVVIGTIGNLAPKKDHATLLAAFATLARHRRDAVLVIVGGGPGEADLRARVARARLSARVILTGQLPDAARLVAAFDVFALSSRHEGLGLVLLEAMAAGVAVVATDVGGVAEVVTDGVDGLLVAPGDPAALAQAIAATLDGGADVEARVQAGRAVVERFSVEGAVRRMEQVYDNVLASCDRRAGR